MAPKNEPQKNVFENWDEACANVSDHALQAAVKRAHSVDAYHNDNLGIPRYDARLDVWGNKQLSQNVQSQPLDEMYDGYPMNGESDHENSEDDSAGDSGHQFWDEQ